MEIQLYEEIDESNVGFTNRAINEESFAYKKSETMYYELVKRGIVEPLSAEEKKGHTRHPHIKKDPKEFHRNKRYVSMGGRGRSLDTYERMTVEQKSKFLELVATSLHDAVALTQVGIQNFKILYREFELDEEFKEKYRISKRYGEGLLEGIVSSYALDSNDHTVALALRKFQETVKNQSIERSLRAREVRAKELASKSQAKAYDEASEQIREASFRNLDRDEVWEYDALKKRLATLTDSEKIRFVELTVKVASPPPSPVPLKSLEALSQIDKQSDEESSSKTSDDDDLGLDAE